MAMHAIHPSPAERLFFTAAHTVRRDIEVLAASAPPRGHVVGPSGSGKSIVLRELHDLLVRDGLTVQFVDAGFDPAQVSPSEVLLVDDLHQLDAERFDAVYERAVDPDAGLVVASRPWPRSDRATEIFRRLESSAPAIILGQVTSSNVRAFLREQGATLPPSCLDQILTFTGGVAWLVSQALANHDGNNCGDGSHLELQHVIEQRILHRLDAIDEPLREMIELTSVGSRPPGVDQDDPLVADDLVAQGYSEGLLLRNGRPIPVVRSAVRASMPVHRIVQITETMADGIDVGDDDGAAGAPAWLEGIDDQRIGTALVAQADRVLDSEPGRAGELYQAASVSGLDPSELTLRQALAAWGAGDLDAAAGFVDSALTDRLLVGDDTTSDTAAAVWSARGMMATGSEVYMALTPRSEQSSVCAAISHIGAGETERLDLLALARTSDTITQTRSGNASTRSASAPSTLGIAMRMLGNGLRSSLDQHPSAATLTQLVRASELYTASRATGPLPELPAVIATAAAIGAGLLAAANSIIDSAVSGGQGGTWAARRLLLWQAWVALQGERVSQAQESLALAEQARTPCSPRDELLRQTILVSLARRYGDLPALEATWQAGIESVRHIDIDLYTLLPMSSLIEAAARLGDAITLKPHLSQGLEILRRLGAPPLWSTRLWWAGVQRGILLNKPDSLAPHAKALVAASPDSHVAETMARAGGVWVAVLAGTVDADAVEAGARDLAAAGLAWDGARLAGHGARKTQDRKVAARLLACARELHPPDAARRPGPAAEAPPNSDRIVRTESSLSDREIEVARLVLQGKTYAEIGQTIFISPRTVEHHIAHMKRRLSATSRSDLIGKLRLAIDVSEGETP